MSHKISCHIELRISWSGETKPKSCRQAKAVSGNVTVSLLSLPSLSWNCGAFPMSSTACPASARRFPLTQWFRLAVCTESAGNSSLSFPACSQGEHKQLLEQSQRKAWALGLCDEMQWWVLRISCQVASRESEVRPWHGEVAVPPCSLGTPRERECRWVHHAVHGWEKCSALGRAPTEPKRAEQSALENALGSRH